jgi:hypothetical protein
MQLTKRKGRILIRKFGHTKQEIVGGLRKLDKETLHNMYFVNNDQMKKDEARERCSCHGENGGGEKQIKILVGKSKRKRRTEIPRRRWKNADPLDNAI